MNKIALLVVSTLALGSTAAFAATTTVVNGGTVHFKGDVVNAACAVDAASDGQTVPMGQVRTAKMDSAGKTSSPQGFEIQLNDCDITISTKASVSFSGTAMASNPTVLALQGSAAGGAENIGIQILDRTSTPLALDGASFSAADVLNEGKNILKFQARYFATGQATAGSANADATFKIQYE